MRTRAILLTAAALLAPACSGPGTTPARTAARPPAPEPVVAAAPAAAPAPAAADLVAARAEPAPLQFAPETEPELEPAPAAPVPARPPVLLDARGLLVEDGDLPEIPLPADGEVLFLGVPPEERPLLFSDEPREPGDAEMPEFDWDGVTVAEPDAMDAEAGFLEAEFEDGAVEPAQYEEILYDEGVQAGEETVYVETPVLVFRGYRTIAYGRFPAVCATTDYDPCARPWGGAWWTTGRWDPCWNPCSDPRYRSWEEYWRVCDEEPEVRTGGTGAVVAAPAPAPAPRPRTQAHGPVYASAPPATRAPRVEDGDYLRTPAKPEAPRAVAPVATEPVRTAAAPRPRVSAPDAGFRARDPRSRASKEREEREREAASGDGRLGTPRASGSGSVAAASPARGGVRREGSARRDDDRGAARGDADDSSRRGGGAVSRGPRRVDEDATVSPRTPARATGTTPETRQGKRSSDAAPERAASRGQREKAAAPAAAPARVAAPAPAPAPAPRAAPSPSRGGGRKSEAEVSSPAPKSKR